MPDGRIVVPDILDTERLQGFRGRLDRPPPLSRAAAPASAGNSSATRPEGVGGCVQSFAEPFGDGAEQTLPPAHDG